MASVMKFDQAGLPAGTDDRSRSDIVAGTAVSITNVSPGTVNTLELLWKPPEDDSAVLSGDPGPVWSITPKAGTWGTYEFRLTVDGVVSEHTFDVRSPVLGEAGIAANEKADPTASLVKNTSTEISASATNEPVAPFSSGSAFGWIHKVMGWFRKLDALFHGTTGHTHDGTAGNGPTITTGTPPHAATTGQTTDDHHNEAHDIDPSSGPHTGGLPEVSSEFDDSAGHDHSGAGGNGAPVQRTNAILEALTADANNYSPTSFSTADIVSIDPQGADRSITGMDATAKVSIKLIGNATPTNNLIIKHEDTNSDAANRFALPGGFDIPLNGGDWATFVYVPLLTRWTVIHINRTTSIANNYILARDTAGYMDRKTPAETQAILDTDPPEVKIKVFSQTAEPTLTKADSLAMWIDTDDSNRSYLIFRTGAAQKKVELT